MLEKGSARLQAVMSLNQNKIRLSPTAQEEYLSASTSRENAVVCCLRLG